MAIFESQYAVDTLDNVQSELVLDKAKAEDGSAVKSWDYTDPNKLWGGLCSSGKEQSPVNFVSAEAVAAPAAQTAINLAAFQVNLSISGPALLSCCQLSAEEKPASRS